MKTIIKELGISEERMKNISKSIAELLKAIVLENGKVGTIKKWAEIIKDLTDIEKAFAFLFVLDNGKAVLIETLAKQQNLEVQGESNKKEC